jgi:hypothetical protein
MTLVGATVTPRWVSVLPSGYVTLCAGGSGERVDGGAGRECAGWPPPAQPQTRAAATVKGRIARRISPTDTASAPVPLVRPHRSE